MLVGENSDAFPASKATTSETNLSTSSRPRPAATGGNYIDGVYARKRRDINNPPHAFVLSNVTTNTSSSQSTSEHDTYSEHASTIASVSTSSSLHDVVTTADEFPLTNGTAITNSTSKNEPSTTESTTIDASSSTEKVQFIPTEESRSTQGPSTESDLDHSPFEENSSSALETSSNSPPSTKEPDVIKIEKDDEVPPEVPVKQLHKHESNSMKPSELESPDAIQHDYPIYSYNQDEVEIVKLNHDTMSTTMKSKTTYNHDKTQKEGSEMNPRFGESDKGSDNSDELTDHNLSATEDGTYKLHLNKPVLKMHEGSDFNNTTNSSFVSETNKQSKISIIEVPPMHSESVSSKRILVNVTIATDPDASNPYASQSVYVLSVSVPTDGNPSHTPDVNVNSNINHNASNRPINPVEEIHATEKSSDHWGGQCECSCPCLDDKPNFTDIFSQDYDYEIDKDPSLLQNISFTTLVDLAKRNGTDIISSTSESTLDVSDSTQSTTETQDWKTETQCPEITTQLPPTPTILILEGRSVSISKPPAINPA